MSVPRHLQNMSDHDWYNNPCFRRFWQHYDSVMTWSRQQLEHSRQSNEQYNRLQRLPAQDFRQIHTPASHHLYRGQDRLHHSSYRRDLRTRQSYSKEYDQDDTLRVGRYHPCSRRQHNHPNEMMVPSDSNESISENSDIHVSMDLDLLDDEEESEDLEMHITSEMLEFFTKSQQHRLERDAAQATREDDEKKEKRIDLASASAQKLRSDITTQAPKERPGLQRTTEMKSLYGKRAAEIHGMETALQMTFDRNCDIQQPKHWPIMPFNIQFHQN